MAKKKQRSLAGRIFRGIGICLLVVVLLFGVLIGFLSVTEYRPAGREAVEVTGGAARMLTPGETLTVVTWNIGYGALGENVDFFMDGGTMVRTADESGVRENLAGILSEIDSLEADIVLLQEADRNSSRSCHVNELELIRDHLTGYGSSFANNFKVAYLPYPMPPLGQLDSGLATFSGCYVSSAERVQLPIPFSWPMRMANLKRCLLVSRVPIQGSDRELVLFNLHLEAYDDGEGKAAQTQMLTTLLQAEAEKGNYVIAGGDFNQFFSSVDMSAYPTLPGRWAAGAIDVEQIVGDWQFLMDDAVPSCRSLDQSYAGADRASFQYYLIDGFIVSGNLEVEQFETLDLGFVNTDHNPVLLQVTLH